MQADIVPALLEAIQASFDKGRASDKTIKSILKKIGDGTADFTDGHEYSKRVGEVLSGTLQKEITPETLPDGKLYWNIADRTVRPMLEQNHALVNETAGQIQRILDEEKGIYLNPVSGGFPEDRVHGLIDKMCGEEDLEKAMKWLGSPIVNCSEAFFDDFIKANAEFKHGAGFETWIERKTRPGCCKWCANLAGIYNYEDVRHGSDVFRRHEDCHCIVTYGEGKKRQNVWNKEEWEGGEDAGYAGEVIKHGEDITSEYLKRALPGVGGIHEEPKFEDKDGEKAAAQWYLDTFGGNITLLAETNPEGVSNPDFLIKNSIKDGLWDLKSPRQANLNTLEQRIRKGVDQISRDTGGVMIDFTKSRFTFEEAARLTDLFGNKRAKDTTDFIVKKGDRFAVIRIKK